MAFFSRFRKSKRTSKAQKRNSVNVTPKSNRPTSPCKRDIPQPEIRSPTPPMSTLTPEAFSARLAAKQTTQKPARPMSTTLTPQEFSARLAAKETILISTRPTSTVLTRDEINARLAAKETTPISTRPTSTVLTPDEVSARIAAKRQSTSTITSTQTSSHPTLRHSRSWSETGHSSRPRWAPRESPIPAVRRLQLEEFSPQASNRKSYATRRKSPLSNLAMVQEPDEPESDSDNSQQNSLDSSRRTSISSRSSVNGECPNCKSSYQSDSSLPISDSGDIKDNTIIGISVAATGPNDDPPQRRRVRSSTVQSWRYSSFMADTEPIIVDRVQPLHTGKSPRRKSLFFHRRTISLSVH